MKKPLQPIAVIGIAIVIMAGVSLYMQPRGKDIIPWRTDFATAKQEAIQSNKRMLLYFTSVGCEPCQRMKQTTWASKDVKASLDSYVPVKLDITYDKGNIELAKYLDIDGVPYFFLLDTDGRIVRRYTQAMEPEEFLAWINPMKR